jgi:large subunit ribosomal protein L17
MRHRKHRSKLGRTTEHRKALMRNLAAALIENGRIRTTHVKASQLRPYIEKLVTKAVKGQKASDASISLHQRRLIFSKLQDKYATHALYEEIAPRFTDRNGGYTRVIKAGNRAGDNAPMAYIEFVDVMDAQEAAPQEEEKSALRRSLEQAKKKGKK